MARSYDVREIRKFLLKHGFNEIIGVETTRRYFIKDRYIVKLIISEKANTKEFVDRLQVELICKNIEFPFEMFEKWHRLAKTQGLANHLSKLFTNKI